jgi:MFS family permease
MVIGGPFVGAFIDRYGRKKLMLAGVVVYALAGASGAFAQTLAALLVGRAVLGLATVAVMTSATTLITDYYRGTARSRFLGLQGAFMGFSGTLLLPIGGLLADINWHIPFLIYAGALLLLPLLAFALYEPARGGGGVSAAADHPAPVRLMLLIYGVVIVMQVVFNTVPVQLPFFLQNLVSAGGSESGIAVAIMTLSFAVSSAFFGTLAARFDYLRLMITGFLLTAAGYLLLGLAHDWTLVLLGLPLGGFGMGLVMPNVSVWLANETPAALRGRLMGGLTTAVFLGQFISPVISEPLSSAVGLAGVYQLAGVLVLALALSFTLTLPRIRRLTPLRSQP